MWVKCDPRLPFHRLLYTRHNTTRWSHFGLFPPCDLNCHFELCSSLRQAYIDFQFLYVICSGLTRYITLIDNLSLIKRFSVSLARAYFPALWLHVWVSLLGRKELTDFCDFVILNEECWDFKIFFCCVAEKTYLPYAARKLFEKGPLVEFYILKASEQKGV